MTQLKGYPNFDLMTYFVWEVAHSGKNYPRVPLKVVRQEVQDLPDIDRYPCLKTNVSSSCSFTRHKELDGSQTTNIGQKTLECALGAPEDLLKVRLDEVHAVATGGRAEISL